MSQVSFGREKKGDNLRGKKGIIAKKGRIVWSVHK